VCAVRRVMIINGWKASFSANHIKVLRGAAVSIARRGLTSQARRGIARTPHVSICFDLVEGAGVKHPFLADFICEPFF